MKFSFQVHQFVFIRKWAIPSHQKSNERVPQGEYDTQCLLGDPSVILSFFYRESLFYYFIIGHATDSPIIKSSMKTNPQHRSIRISMTQAHYLIKGQPLQLGLFLCNCRQARLTDGGRGTVLMGVDIRQGVMLWINLRGEVSTEGCQTVARSMNCRNRRSC